MLAMQRAEEIKPENKRVEDESQVPQRVSLPTGETANIGPRGRLRQEVRGPNGTQGKENLSYPLLAKSRRAV